MHHTTYFFRLRQLDGKRGLVAVYEPHFLAAGRTGDLLTVRRCQKGSCSMEASQFSQEQDHDGEDRYKSYRKNFLFHSLEA